MARMRFVVAGQTREWSEPGTGQGREGPLVNLLELEGEARRRKVAMRLDEWQMREYVSGTPIPERVRQLCQQIDLAAQALARMSPIPKDFRDDVYWPRMW